MVADGEVSGKKFMKMGSQSVSLSIKVLAFGNSGAMERSYWTKLLKVASRQRVWVSVVPRESRQRAVASCVFKVTGCRE
jgi:hypothetical protein